MPNELITVITSTFNAVQELPKTAESIRQQTVRVQWIIADGGSTDGTLEWIKENTDIIDTWFSGSDGGIYDAWNKALPFIKGQWVQFLGAGDTYYASNSLECVASTLAGAHPDHDLVYGKIQIMCPKSGDILEEIGEPWDVLKGQWDMIRPKLPVHPEVFHHCSLFSTGMRFDSKYRIAGDSHFLLRSIRRLDPLYCPVLLVKMVGGGVSTRYRSSLKLLDELKCINDDLRIQVPTMIYISGVAKMLAKYVLSRVVPARILGAHR